MFSGSATPTYDTTGVLLTTGLFLNNNLEDELTVPYTNGPVSGSDFRGAALPPGTYTVSVRARASATKAGNTLTYRIAVV